METISAPTAYPVTPQSQMSHLRSSSQFSQADPASAAEATRIMQQADSQTALLSAPASQESLLSVHGAGSVSGPTQLQTSSSNVSQLTTETDFTSYTAASSSGLEQGYEQYVVEKPGVSRLRTPEEGARLVGQSEVNHTATSPMSLTSPAATNGTKRTASGHVKNAPSLSNTPLTSTFGGRRARTDSISSTGSRAGDLAMTLKARLGYAMAKVQNGWEHKSINEVENLAMHRASPNPNRHSMSHLESSRRPMTGGWGYPNGRFSMYETNGHTSFLDSNASQPSKRHSGNYSSYISSSQPTLSTGPRLQPAPDIRPQSSSQRAYHTQPSSQPNPTNHTYNTNTNSTVMSPPRTPVNGDHVHLATRPPTIRTELQTAEAERDALQALFQLGSPQGSQFPRHHHYPYQDASQGSSSQASPMRAEFATPRRVTFARSESGSSIAKSQSEDGSLGEREKGGREMDVA